MSVDETTEGSWIGKLGCWINMTTIWLRETIAAKIVFRTDSTTTATSLQSQRCGHRFRRFASPMTFQKRDETLCSFKKLRILPATDAISSFFDIALSFTSFIINATSFISCAKPHFVKQSSLASKSEKTRNVFSAASALSPGIRLICNVNSFH